MFLRFVVDQLDEDSERSVGVFTASAELRDRGELSDSELEELAEVRAWFNLYLERLFSFSRSIFFRDEQEARYLMFRDSAHEHIAKAREFSDLLQRHGVHVTVLHAKRLGYVVYEDQFQEVAEPFADLDC